jgi:hypothetical protein
MMVDIFGRLQYVHKLKEDIDIEGERLYVFLKEHVKNSKVTYEYMGSMFSTLEDNSADFFRPFLTVATHYCVPPDETLSEEAHQLKEQLDDHDRGLFFDGKEEER